MERFRHGLKPLVRRAIAPISFTTFEDLLKGAREFERENIGFMESRNKMEKRKMFEHNFGKQQ